MDFWVVVLGVLVLAGAGAAGYLVYLQFRRAGESRSRRPGAVKRSPARSAQLAQPFRATAIQPGRGACAAVRELAGNRYLVSEADIPMLPLPGCDAAQCSCTYAKFPDRREEEEDRRTVVGMQQRMREQGGGQERRSGRERRAGPGYSWD